MRASTAAAAAAVRSCGATTRIPTVGARGAWRVVNPACVSSSANASSVWTRGKEFAATPHLHSSRRAASTGPTPGLGDSDDSDDEYDDEFAQAITNTAAAAAAAQAAAEAEAADAADTATPSGDAPREGTDATNDAPASMTAEEQALSFAAAAVKSLGDSETQATTPYKVAITGSTGMIGTALTKALMVPRLENRHNPVVLRMVRGKAQQSHDVRFLPDDSFVDVPKLEACEAIVNLAGQPLGVWMGVILFVRISVQSS